MSNPMRFKKEYIILLVIIVGLSLYLWQDKSGRMHYELPQLQSLDTKQLSRVEIERPEGTVSLNKKDGRWLVGEQAYAADKGKVDSLLQSIADVDLSALVSESKTYSRYGLEDEQRLTVTAYQNGTVVRSFSVGKASPNRSGTYIRLHEDPNVYLTGGNLNRQLDQSAQRLRDKTVLSFNEDEVTKLTVAKGSKRVTLKKQPAKQGAEGQEKEEPDHSWARSDNSTLVSQKEIDGLLAQLHNLQCTKYLADDAVMESASPEYSITVHAAKEHQLLLYRISPKPSDSGEEDVAYQGNASDSASPFRLSKYRVDRLTKLIDPLFEKDQGEES